MSSSFVKKDDIDTDHIEKLLQIFHKINDRSIWSKVKNAEDFTVKRFQEGFVNDICACVLTDEAQSRLLPARDDPLGVVVKIFPKTPFGTSDPVKRALAYTTISTAGLGPKLIYMDADCCVNEYLINGRHHLSEDDHDDELVSRIFKSLAHYHHLNVPVSNSAEHWGELLNAFSRMFDGAQEALNGKLFEFLAEDEEFSSYAETFREKKFGNMFKYFPEVSHQLGSPIVFSHMDFHRENRIIVNRILPDCRRRKDVYFIDFDTSIYCYRGFDLGCFFNSYLQKDSVEIVDDSKIFQLIEVYRQECAKIVGEEYLLDVQNSAENILREAKFFVIYYFFIYDFFGVAMYCQDPKKARNREFLKAVYHRHKAVMNLFQQYKEEGWLPDVGIDIW